MRGGRQTHDLAPQRDRENLTSIEPSGTVQHAVIRHHKQVDGQDREALSDAIVGVLEFALHHSSIDLDEHDATKAGKNHLATTPLIGQEFSGDGVAEEGTGAVD